MLLSASGHESSMYNVKMVQGVVESIVFLTAVAYCVGTALEPPIGRTSHHETYSKRTRQLASAYAGSHLFHRFQEGQQ